MIILRTNTYKDGGTLEYTTDQGVYCLDFRMGTETRGQLYRGYPDRGVLIKDYKIKNELLLAISKTKSWSDFNDLIIPENIINIINITKELPDIVVLNLLNYLDHFPSTINIVDLLEITENETILIECRAGEDLVSFEFGTYITWFARINKVYMSTEDITDGFDILNRIHRVDLFNEY